MELIFEKGAKVVIHLPDKETIEGRVVDVGPSYVRLNNITSKHPDLDVYVNYAHISHFYIK